MSVRWISLKKKHHDGKMDGFIAVLCSEDIQNMANSLGTIMFLLGGYNRLASNQMFKCFHVIHNLRRKQLQIQWYLTLILRIPFSFVWPFRIQKYDVTISNSKFMFGSASKPAPNYPFDFFILFTVHIRSKRMQQSRWPNCF